MNWWFCTGSGGCGNDAMSKYANLHIYMNFRKHSGEWLISSQMHSGSSWAETEDDLPCYIHLIFDKCEYDEYSSQIMEWELPRRGWDGLNMQHPCVININCRINCTSIGGQGRKGIREQNMLDSRTPNHLRILEIGVFFLLKIVNNFILSANRNLTQPDVLWLE